MRSRHDEIRGLGGEVVLIGTGSRWLAEGFVEQEQIPFPVLVDDDAAAARTASVERVGPLRLFHPSSYSGTRRAWRAGHRLGLPGKRTNQLGASFVIGPRGVVHYQHWDAHSADHAPMHEVLAALKSASQAS